MKHDHCKQDLFYKPPNVIYDHIQRAVQHKQNSMHAFTIMRFQKGKQVNGKGKKLWAVLGSTAGDKTVVLAAQNNEWCVKNATNLFGEGLAVLSFAVEDNIAIVINWVANGNHTKHIKWQL